MRSGHGDDRPDELYRPLPPEVHQGVVLPAQDPQPWAGPVQPADGLPWDRSPQPSQPQQSSQPQQTHGGYESGQPQYVQPDHGRTAEATQLFPPYPQAVPLPPAPGDAEATQLLRPVPDPLPPVTAPAAPPMPGVAPFAIRPGLPGEPPPDLPSAGAEATQHLPRFAEPDATQHLPRFGEPPQPAPGGDYDHLYRRDDPQPPPYQAPPSRQESPRRETSRRAPASRRLSPAALVAIVVGGCAAAGLAAGAALGGSGDSTPQQVQDGTTPAVTATPTGPAESGREAEEQAKALDELLADSGSSRSSVIKAVEDIKSCQNLDQAAADLRAAAQQRNDLVTRLAALSVDQLPDHQALTDALNKAWKASAAADDHYAAWAEEARDNKKICKGGRARPTSHTAAGNRESGNATAAKKQAVALWNVIAERYGLTQRQVTQL